TAVPHPVVKVVVNTDAWPTELDGIQAQLTWKGQNLGWVTFSTSDFSPGDSILIALAGPAGATDTYDWTVTVKVGYIEVPQQGSPYSFETVGAFDGESIAFVRKNADLGPETGAPGSAIVDRLAPGSDGML